MRVIVTGLIGSIPIAGLTLHYLQYVLGLKKLGHDVLYLEDTGTWCYDPATDSMIENSAHGLKYLADIMHAYDHADRWTFIGCGNKQFGVTGSRLSEYLKTADIFINVTGAGILRDDYMQITNRAYIDTDPGFIQLRLANNNEQDRKHLGLHTSHFSFGCNIGGETCTIPPGNIDWKPTVQPICLGLWPIIPVNDTAPFTTIMKWKSYQPEEYAGTIYGLKDQELLHYIDLPARSGQSFELAIRGNPPEDDLRSAGWEMRNALEVSDSIETYRTYIQASRGEWSIAKNAYVAMHSGWFSERSACYLASGRPVVVQETGFSEWMDTHGLGVVPFSSLDEASSAIEDVVTRYAQHAIRAREIAQEYFAAKKVLSKLLDEALLA